MFVNNFSNRIRSFAKENTNLCILALGVTVICFLGKFAGRTIAWLQECLGTTKKTDLLGRSALQKKAVLVKEDKPKPVVKADEPRKAEAAVEAQAKPVVKADEPRKAEAAVEAQAKPVVKADEPRKPEATVEAQAKPIVESAELRKTPLISINELWQKLIKSTNSNLILFHPRTALRHRFCDIHCTIETSVKIDGHYLHANVVGKDESDIEFVASQAPLEEDENLFWKAIFDKNYAIVDLTTLADQRETAPGLKDGLKKYYPEVLNEPKICGSLTITLLNQDGFFREYQILDSLTGVTKKIIRYHFDRWVDFGAVSIPILKDLIDNLEKKMGKQIWVHCRAGVGRTGTLITAFLVKEKIKNSEITEENLDEALVNLICKLRKQRDPYFVQQPAQLNLIREYAKSLLKHE